MNWRQFIASLVGSLAWPVTIVIALSMFRNHLGALFPLIDRLKYGSFEVAFRDSIRKLAEESRKALPTDQTDAQATSPREHLYALADISPRAAIIEAWLQVEAAAAEALSGRVPPLSGKLAAVAPLKLGQYLEQHHIVTAPQAKIFYRLRELRNRAVHAAEASFHLQEVREYIDLATALAAQIKKTST